MPSNFESFLTRFADDHRIGLLGGGNRRLKRVLDMQAGPLKDAILGMLESLATVFARRAMSADGLGDGTPDDAPIDWNVVAARAGDRDWEGFFKAILNFFVTILPLILPLFI